jgi:hypothetical protein
MAPAANVKNPQQPTLGPLRAFFLLMQAKVLGLAADLAVGVGAGVDVHVGVTRFEHAHQVADRLALQAADQVFILDSPLRQYAAELPFFLTAEQAGHRRAVGALLRHVDVCGVGVHDVLDLNLVGEGLAVLTELEFRLARGLGIRFFGFFLGGQFGVETVPHRKTG